MNVDVRQASFRMMLNTWVYWLRSSSFLKRDRFHPRFWPFHLSPQDDQLLTEECVFCDKFGLATGLASQRPQYKRGGVRFGPSDARGGGATEDTSMSTP